MLSRTRTKLFWIGILYFGEGFPFGLLVDFYPVYFRLHGVSLTQIGLLSIIGLTWTLKWIWAPLVDLWGAKKHWIISCQTLIALGTLLSLFIDPSHVGLWVWTLLLMMACVSATQDIAIDAYSIQLLEQKELGPGNGIRVTTYRIALIAAGGLFLAAGGVLGWPSTIAGAALLMAGSSFLLLWKLPRIVQPVHQTSDSLYQRAWAPFSELFGRPGFVPVAFFILLFKLGDMSLGPMIRPFWVDQDFSPVQIGIVPGTIGVVSTIVGALIGGIFTEKWGLYRAMWIFGVVQACSNLVYVLAAASSPSPLLMYTASIVESLCGGLGTAPFLAFLMSICNKTFAASQYAILSALFGLTRVVAGSFSGIVTESVGYTIYFSLTFFLAFPAFLLLPFVKRWVAETDVK